MGFWDFFAGFWDFFFGIFVRVYEDFLSCEPLDFCFCLFISAWLVRVWSLNIDYTLCGRVRGGVFLLLRFFFFDVDSVDGKMNVRRMGLSLSLSLSGVYCR